MKLRYYLLLRLWGMIPVILGVLTITFFISRIIPGDPVLLIAGPLSSESTRQKIRAEYGLDKPLPIQYLDYLAKIFTRGDMGTSLRTRRSVYLDFVQFFPATFELVATSIIPLTIVSIFIGVISATKRNTWIDHTARIFALSGFALPAFWLGLILQLIFGYTLHWFSIAGRIDVGAYPQTITGLFIVDSILTHNWPALRSTITHLMLPAITLAYTQLAYTVRMIRSSMLDVLRQDYIRTLRAYGLSENVVVYKHALKNALIPSITTISLNFASMFSGCVLVEMIFNWPGAGQYIAEAVLNLDFPAIMGGVILLSLVVLFTNLIVDLMYAAIDPRIRYG